MYIRCGVWVLISESSPLFLLEEEDEILMGVNHSGNENRELLRVDTDEV